MAHCKIVLGLKVVAFIVLLVTVIVGCIAHFNSTLKEVWDASNGIAKEICKFADEVNGFSCFYQWESLELGFVSLSITFLILSAVNVLAYAAKFFEIPKTIDMIYNAIAALAVFSAGALILASAIGLNNSGGPNVNMFLVTKDDQKYNEKLAAASLAIIDAVLYVAVTAAIFKAGKK